MVSDPAAPDAGDGAGRAQPGTLPGWVTERARRYPDHVALQEKRYGIWQPLTWRGCEDAVRDVAHGLASLGVDRGEAVAVIGDNRPEWVIAELAVQALGAAVIAVDPAGSDEEIARALDLAGVRVSVVQGQQQVDQLVEHGRQPSAVVYYEPHGLEHYTEPYLHEFSELRRRGRDWGRDRPGWLDARLADGRTDDVALIRAAAGTRHELTHRAILVAADRLTAVDPVTSGDRYVCLASLSSIGEQVLGVACAVTRGVCLSLPEQAATQRGDLREIGPDLVVAPPRCWEALLSEVRQRLAESGRLKRAVFGWGYRVADAAAARRMRGRRPGLLTLLAYPLAEVMALRPVRDQLGLLRARHCYAGGAPLAAEVLGFFHALGVNLKQTYSRVELAGAVAVHRDGDIAPGTVGPPLPGIDVEVSERGEILLRAGDQRRHREADTAGADSAGRLHTGDLGHLDDAGHLVVLGPPADTVAAGDGRRFGKAHIEATLRASPYLADAVVVGEPQSAGVCALVTIDPRSVAAWAQRSSRVPAGEADLAARDEVRELVADEVDRANRHLPEAVRVHRFAVLGGRFAPDEITAAGEVRRELVASRHAELIEALQRGDGAATPRPGVARHRPVWRR